jgi:hypothetical protein
MLLFGAFLAWFFGVFSFGAYFVGCICLIAWGGIL